MIWDPAATKTISAKTHHQNIDFNIFEGMGVKGLASTTVSNGKVVWADGQLRAVQGAGRYIKRPAFQSMFGALGKLNAARAPTAVKRSAAVAAE